MHTCPDCGQACYCHGDIDDHDTGEDDRCEHYLECNDGEYSDDDADDDGFGCCFPGECCMPGEHLRSECHTAADYEAQMEEPPNATGKQTDDSAAGGRSA